MFTPRDLVLGIDGIFFFVGLLIFIAGLIPGKGEVSNGQQAFAMYTGGIVMFVAGMLWMLWIKP